MLIKSLNNRLNVHLKTSGYINENKDTIIKSRFFFKSTAASIVDRFMSIKDTLNKIRGKNTLIQRQRLNNTRPLKEQFDNKVNQVNKFNEEFNNARIKLMLSINTYSTTSFFSKKQKTDAVALMKNYLAGKTEFSEINNYMNKNKQATSGTFSHRVADMFEQIKDIESKKPYKGPILIPNTQQPEENSTNIASLS